MITSNQNPGGMWTESSHPAYTHIRLDGQSADLEGYAIFINQTEERREATLWYLSMVGNTVAVNAIWAGLVTQPPQAAVIYLQDNEGRISQEMLVHYALPQQSGGSSSTQLGLRLSGGVQKVLLPEIAKPLSHRKKQRGEEAAEPDHFLLLIPSPHRRYPNSTDPESLYYTRLTELSHEPLHPAWKKWLWLRGLERGEIHPLLCGGLAAAYLCQLPDPTELEAEIGTELSCGELPTG